MTDAPKGIDAGTPDVSGARGAAGALAAGAPSMEALAGESESPNVKITDIGVGMKISHDGKTYYVEDVFDESSQYGPSVAEDIGPQWRVRLVEIDGDKKNPSSVHSQRQLLEKLNNPDSGWKPDPVIGRKYKDEASGKTYEVWTDYDESGPRVSFRDESGKKVYSEERGIFDEAVARGMFTRVNPEPVSPEPASSEEERINYNSEYVARFEKAKAEAEARGEKYEHPGKAGKGWKIHLNVPADPDNPLTSRIAEFTNKHRLLYKVGKGGTEEDGKGMTIYIGDRDTTVEFAKELNEEFHDELPEPMEATMHDDVQLAGNVRGRFEAFRYHGHGLPEMHQYGSGGVSFLNDDMMKLHSFGGNIEIPEGAADVALERADKTLEDAFGGFYRGTSEESKFIPPRPTNPPTEKAKNHFLPVEVLRQDAIDQRAGRGGLSAPGAITSSPEPAPEPEVAAESAEPIPVTLGRNLDAELSVLRNKLMDVQGRLRRIHEGTYIGDPAIEQRLIDKYQAEIEGVETQIERARTTIPDSGPTIAPQTPEARRVEPGPPTDGAGSQPKLEARIERRIERVIGALNHSYNEYRAAHSVDPWETADRRGMDKDWARTYARGQGGYYFTLDTNGIKHAQYLQMHGMMSWLESKIQDASLPPKAQKEFQRDFDILKKYTRKASDIDRGRARSGEQFSSLRSDRVHRELERIKANPELTTGNPEEDLRIAEYRVDNVITQLVGPRIRRNTLPQPTNETPPADAAPPAPVETLPAEGPPPPAEPAEPEPGAATEEPPPAPPTVEEIREIVFTFANATGLKDKKADEMAEAHVREGIRLGSILNPKNWRRKIGWRLQEPGIKHRFADRIRMAMVDSGNSNAQLELSLRAADGSVRTIDPRRNENLDYQEGLAKIEAIRMGERTAADQVVEAQGTLRDAMISQIIRPAVEAAIAGRITTIQEVQQTLKQFIFDNQPDAQVQAIFGSDVNRYGELADYFATDLLENARLISEAIRVTRFSLDQIDGVVKIQLANARWSAETERQQTAIDRAIVSLERRGIDGRFLNPATIGATLSIAVYTGASLTGTAARVATAIPLIGSIPAAFFAAARRSHELNVDINAHKIERTYNQQIPSNARRRQELERFTYNTASVTELLNGGRRLTPGENLTALGGDIRGINELINLDLSQETNQNLLMRRMVEIRTRLDYSADNHLDLITFESRNQVEHGRLELIRSLTEARVRLANAGIAEGDIDSRLQGFQAEFTRDFIQNVEQQERSFTRFRAQQALKSGAFAGAAGLVFGVVGQEVVAVTGRAVAGLNIGQTALESLAGIRGNLPGGGGGVIKETVRRTVKEATNTLLSSNTPLVDSNIGGRHFKIPEGTFWEKGPDGKLDLVLKDGGKPLLEDVSFDKKGNLYFDKDSLLADGVTEGRGERVTREMFGENGQWAENRTPIDHREWYSYDKPHSQGNELRLYDGIYENKQGQRYVVLNMSNMHLGYQAGLHPNPIDVQDVIKNHKSGFAFSMYVNGHSQTIWVPDGADGTWDGKLRLNPLDNNPKHFVETPQGRIQLGEFSRMVLNEKVMNSLPIGNTATELYNHRDLFNLRHGGKDGFIEAGRLVKGKNGNTLQAFATILGSGNASSQITTISPPAFTIKPTEIINRVQIPTEIVDRIPETSQPIDIPPIVLPFAPRFPLEATMPASGRETIPRGDYYYRFEGNLTPEQRTFYERRRSQRLKDNPDINLDPEIEIPDYFARQSPEYMRGLEDYLNQEGMREPMDPNCDAIVCIPAYDLGEGKIIENTLNQYLQQIDSSTNQQAIDPSKFEIILFLNHPLDPSDRNKDGNRTVLEQRLGTSYLEGAEDRVRSGNPEIYDTEEVIKQFREAHPELRIRIMKKEFQTRPLWGDIIKPLYDIGLLRSMRRTEPFRRDPLIITNDADVVHMSPTYLRDILQAMDFNQIAAWRNSSVRKLDGLVGNTDQVKEGYRDAPGFLLSQRLFNFLELQNRGNHSTQGRNTILRGSSYAAIGGVNNETNAGADGELGSMLNMARGNNGPRHPYLHSAWLQTDPRREFDSWRKGVPLVANWYDWDSRNIYGQTWEQRFIESAGTNPTDIKASLEREVNAYVEIGWWGDINGVYMQRSLDFLGLRNHQALLDRAFWKGTDADSPSIPQMLASLNLKPEDYHIEELNIEGKTRKRIVIDSARGHQDYHTERRTNEKGETREYLVIDDLTNVNRKLKKYIDEKRWEVTEGKIENAKNHRPGKMVTDKYYAEYMDYEEFNGIYGEIFISRDYPWSPDLSVNPNPTVIDLGGHIGMSVIYWKTIAPDAKVTVVEANPKTADVLERNIKRNKFKNVDLVRGAATSRDGNVELYLPKPGVDFRWGDFVGGRPVNESQYDKVPVPSVKLSSLIKGPVDLLKIDIEGSELDVLKEAEGKLSQVKELMIEFHNDPGNPTNSFAETMEILRRQGYEVSGTYQGRPLDLSTIEPGRKIFFNIHAKRPEATPVTLPSPTPSSAPSGPVMSPASLSPTPPAPVPIPPPPPLVPGPTPTGGRVNTAFTRAATGLRSFESNARNFGRTSGSSLLERTIAPAGNLWAGAARPIRAGVELGARITRPRTTTPPVTPPAPPPATPTPTPPAPLIRAPYTGPEPRASDRFISAEDRARQREIDRENALARRTGRALNNAAANVSTTLASGTRKTGEVTARAGRAAVRTGVKVASTTAQAGAKTASGVALGIGQTAGKIPERVINATSPLSGIGYGGGVVPIQNGAVEPEPTPESISTTEATAPVLTPTPAPATVPPPAPEPASPITVGIGTTVYSTNGSEYRIVDEETIAGVKLFNLQPLNGNANIRSSVAEKDLLNPTQFSRFRLPQGVLESVVPGDVQVPTSSSRTQSDAPQPEPETPDAGSVPLATYQDEQGGIYELIESDNYGARVRYPDREIHYVPRNLFDLSGEFFNPNATPPVIETPSAEAPAPEPIPAVEPEPIEAVIPAPASITLKPTTKPTTFQRTIETAIQGAERAQDKIGGFAEKPTHRTIRSVTAVPLAAGVRNFKEVSKLAGQVTPANTVNKAGAKLGTVSGVAGRKIGEFFAKRSK